MDIQESSITLKSVNVWSVKGQNVWSDQRSPHAQRPTCCCSNWEGSTKEACAPQSPQSGLTGKREGDKCREALCCGQHQLDITPQQHKRAPLPISRFF